MRVTAIFAFIAAAAALSIPRDNHVETTATESATTNIEFVESCGTVSYGSDGFMGMMINADQMCHEVPEQVNQIFLRDNCMIVTFNKPSCTRDGWSNWFFKPGQFQPKPEGRWYVAYHW